MIPALHALATVLAFANPTIDSVERDAKEVLADERYDFCDADSGYLLWSDDRDWCELVGPRNERCPGFYELCDDKWQGGDTPVAAEPGDNTRTPPKKKGKGVFNKGAGGDDPKKDPTTVRVNPGLSSFSQMLMWALAIGGLLMLIWSIVRNRGTGRDEEEEVHVDQSPLDPELPPGDAARRIIETDVTRLLERARQNAGRGEYRLAVNDLYAALLRRLDGDGLIEIHRARTNGDYVRDLRDKPQLRGEVRSVLRDVEHVQFGDTEPSEPVYRRILDKVKPLVTRQLGGLILAFLMGATLGGCDYGDDEHEGLAGLDTSPTGIRAFIQILRRQDVDAHHRTRTLEQLRKKEEGAMFLFGDVAPSDEEWDELLAWTKEGGTLIIATGRDDLPARLGIDVVLGEVDSESDTYLEFVDGYEYRYEGLTLRTPRYGRLEANPNNYRISQMIVRPLQSQGEDVMEDEFGEYYAAPSELYAARVSQGLGEVIVFADPMLFENASMAVEDNAYFATDLLTDFGGEIEIIDEWTGTGAQNPLQSIENSAMTPVILQLLAFMALLYLWRGIAFGRLRDPATRGRRAFVDHVHALALQYAKARASRHVLGMYTTWVLERLRDRVAPGTQRSLHGLAQAVAARTGRPEAEVMRLLVEAHSLRESSSHASGVYTARKHDLELMRELTRLLSASKRSRKKK